MRYAPSAALAMASAWEAAPLDYEAFLALTYSDEYDLMPVIQKLRENRWIIRPCGVFPPQDLSLLVKPLHSLLF